MAKYYVGMDLASESVEYFVLGPRGGKKAAGKMSWAPAKWKSFVAQYGAENLVVAFETSPEAYRAQRVLERASVETYPFHAGHFPAIWNSKKKTDRIDAEKIARGLRGETLPRRIRLADKTEAALRNRVSEREAHRKQLLQAHNRIRGLARQHGVTLPRYHRESAEAWWMTAPERFPARDRRSILRVARTALSAYQAMEELQEEMDVMMREAGYGDAIGRLRTVPGFGPVTSAAMALYLRQGNDFASGRCFGAYLGLVPTVESTGKQAPRLGHITKEGPAALRRLLVQAAHAALRSRAFAETRLDYWFRRVAKRRGKKIAIVALARKLAVIAYAIHRDGSQWDAEK